MAVSLSARVRMYRLLELGDCFLVTFTAGEETSHMLIDCGSFRNGRQSQDQLNKITRDIITTLDKKSLNVVVATHQHNDHVSGFVHCEEAFRNEMRIGQVWLSWLDDPADKRAQAISDARRTLVSQLVKARKALSTGTRPAREPARLSLRVLDDSLGLYGVTGNPAEPTIPARGIKILRDLGSKDPLYLRPGRTLEMPGLPRGTVRVHVLGPPRRDDLLKRKDPRRGESYDHAVAAAKLQADKLWDAVRCRGRGAEEIHYPFNAIYQRPEKTAGTQLKKIVDDYRLPDAEWRTIDEAWMESAGTLALYLDDLTNNSSLVLAIELVKSGKVLLFAADAQTGNWLSWNDVKWERKGISTDDLLARTVFYKVGHHASHNATLPAVFAKMTHRELVALIPVHQEDPNIKREKGGWKMPAKNLFKRLQQSTKNRVLRMDGEDPDECKHDQEPARAAWRRIGIKPHVTELAIELEIRDEAEDGSPAQAVAP